jgi:hypothetical protein
MQDALPPGAHAPRQTTGAQAPRQTTVAQAPAKPNPAHAPNQTADDDGSDRAPDIAALLSRTYTQRIQNQESKVPMPTLTDEMKTFIVMGLARFDSPSKVAADVQSTFDVEMTRHHVHRYDPACAQKPAARWCELHAATRKAFLEELTQIGVSHKVVRLKMLDEMTQSFIDRHYFLKAALLLEQAAKECGGIYERGRRLPQPASEQDSSPPVA